MKEEEKIKQELEEKFSFLKDKIAIKRERRIFVDVPLEKFSEVFDTLVTKMNFAGLSAITGLDDITSFAVIYHLNKDDKVILNLRVSLAKDDPVVKSVTSYFPSADIFERELEDLFGIKVEGLAAGHSYPLPDNWPKGEFPLRKDWKDVHNA